MSCFTIYSSAASLSVSDVKSTLAFGSSSRDLCLADSGNGSIIFSNQGTSIWPLLYTLEELCISFSCCCSLLFWLIFYNHFVFVPILFSTGSSAENFRLSDIHYIEPVILLIGSADTGEMRLIDTRIKPNGAPSEQLSPSAESFRWRYCVGDGSQAIYKLSSSMSLFVHDVRHLHQPLSNYQLKTEHAPHSCSHLSVKVEHNFHVLLAFHLQYPVMQSFTIRNNVILWPHSHKALKIHVISLWKDSLGANLKGDSFIYERFLNI